MLAGKSLSKQQVISNYIALAGNMGVGKTTLTRILNAWQPKNFLPYEEPEVTNPYLSDQYEAIKTGTYSPYVLTSQMFFLIHKGNHLSSISKKAMRLKKGQHLWLDRTIYEDAEIFAKGLMDRGLIDKRGTELYTNQYRMVLSLTSKPSILFYVVATPEECWQRALNDPMRDESILPPDLGYIVDLDTRYEVFIHDFEKDQLFLPRRDRTSVVPIDTSGVDLRTLDGQNYALETVANTLSEEGLMRNKIELPDRILVPNNGPK